MIDKNSTKILVRVKEKELSEEENKHFKTQFSKNYPKVIKDIHINKIEELGEIFPQVREEFNKNNAVITSNNRLNKTGAQFKSYASGKPINIEFGSQYKTQDALEKMVEQGVKKNFYMPTTRDNYKNYLATHEFGHAIENHIINKIIEKGSWKDDSGWKFYYRKLQEDKIETTIINIAKDNYKDFNLSENLSKYGSKNSSEFFAETFANAFCGKPNELGKSMIQYLKEIGGIEMIIEEPYFFKNKKWYFYDEKKKKCFLTKEGNKNKKVVDSYNEFYKDEIYGDIRVEK